MAARCNNIEVVRVLLAYSFKVDSLNQWWRLLIYRGLYLTLLFSRGELIEEDFDYFRGLCKSPLLEAVENNNIDMVDILLRSSADVNKRVIRRFGIYYLDVAQGNCKMYNILINLDAYPERLCTLVDLQLVVRRKDSRAVEDLL